MLIIKSVYYPFKFSNAAGLFEIIAPTVGQISNSGQPPQVETPFSKAHFRISHRCSQNTVFAPFARQPSQLICPGKIGALFNAAHSFAVFLVGIAFSSNCDIVHFGNLYDTGLVLRHIEFLVFFLIIKSRFSPFPMCNRRIN